MLSDVGEKVGSAVGGGVRLGVGLLVGAGEWWSWTADSEWMDLAIDSFGSSFLSTLCNFST